MVPPRRNPPSPDRRHFLTALGSAAAIAASPSLGNTAPTPSRRPTIGFLGTAYSHFREKHRLLRESPHFELVGLSEDDPAVRAAGPADARWLSRKQLLDACEVVVVESAPQHHARDAKAALEADRHVHLEKPPAESLPAFRALIDLARKRRRHLQIGYMWRYNPGIQAAIAAGKNGWLGDIFLVRATMNTSLEGSQRPEWARFRGGAMFEQGSHLIDMVVRLLGRPIRVTPFLKTSGPFDDRLADNTLAVLEYPKAWAIVTSAPLQPNAGPHRFLEILGTNGVARVQPLEPPGFFVDLKSTAGPYAAGRQEIALPPYQRYVDEFAALARAVGEGTPLPVTPDVELEIQDTLMRACDMGPAHPPQP